MHKLAKSQRLRAVGLRPTAQRIALAELLFGQGDRHVTAEMLHEEAVASGIELSVATVYNTLNQFRDVRLLRTIAIDSSRLWFDTNLSSHHHFYYEETGQITDLKPCGLEVRNLPVPPADMEIIHVDVVLRLKPVGRRYYLLQGWRLGWRGRGE